MHLDGGYNNSANSFLSDVLSSPGCCPSPIFASINNDNFFQFPQVVKEEWPSQQSQPQQQQSPQHQQAQQQPDHHQQAGGQSPMAISPCLSTLNTPRGSITSMRSQHSPMHTDLDQHARAAQPEPTLPPPPFLDVPDSFLPTTFTDDQTCHYGGEEAFVADLLPQQPSYPSPPCSGYGSPNQPSYDHHHQQQQQHHLNNHFDPSFFLPPPPEDSPLLHLGESGSR